MQNLQPLVHFRYVGLIHLCYKHETRHLMEQYQHVVRPEYAQLSHRLIKPCHQFSMSWWYSNCTLPGGWVQLHLLIFTTVLPKYCISWIQPAISLGCVISSYWGLTLRCQAGTKIFEKKFGYADLSRFDIRADYNDNVPVPDSPDDEPVPKSFRQFLDYFPNWATHPDFYRVGVIKQML